MNDENGPSRRQVVRNLGTAVLVYAIARKLMTPLQAEAQEVNSSRAGVFAPQREDLVTKIRAIESYLRENPTGITTRRVESSDTKVFIYEMPNDFVVQITDYDFIIRKIIKDAKGKGVRERFFYDSRKNGLGTVDAVVNAPALLSHPDAAKVEEDFYSTHEKLRRDIVEVTKRERKNSLDDRMVYRRWSGNIFDRYDFKNQTHDRDVRFEDYMQREYINAVTYVYKTLPIKR